MKIKIYGVPHNAVVDKLLRIPESEIEKLYPRNIFGKKT